MPTSGWRGPLRRTEPFLVAQGSSGVGCATDPFRRNLRPFPTQETSIRGGRTFLPSHDLGGKLPIRPAGLAMLCGECCQWPSSTAWCKMLTAFRGEGIWLHKNRTSNKTVCSTSRIRTLIEPHAPRRRFYTGGGGASLGLYRIGIPTRSAPEGRDEWLGWGDGILPATDMLPDFIRVISEVELRVRGRAVGG